MTREEVMYTLSKFDSVSQAFVGALLSGGITTGEVNYIIPGNFDVNAASIYKQERYFDMSDLDISDSSNFDMTIAMKWIDEQLESEYDVALIIGEIDLQDNSEFAAKYGLPLVSNFDAIISKFNTEYYLNYTLEDDNSQLIVVPVQVGNFLEHIVNDK